MKGGTTTSELEKLSGHARKDSPTPQLGPTEIPGSDPSLHRNLYTFRFKDL